MASLKQFVLKYQIRLLWLFMALYFIVFSLISLWKYYSFGYNGLDLAIFNQVFYNSIQGNLFNFTIHPHSYLGDHFDLFILLLLPLYYLWQSPETLLILQSLFLALSAWPLFLISKKILPPIWPLVVVLFWLLNPFVQNINLFEFHMLPFAVFLIFWSFYFYQQKKFTAFILISVLALLVREDIALVIGIFGILAFFEKRDWKWIFWPIILAGSWFVIAMKFIDYFTPTGSYKFLYYYAWLGGSVSEMIINIFFHPWKLISHIFSLNNFLFLLLLLMPFGYLVILKPKYLLISSLIYLQIILTSGTYASITLKMHYGSLLLPGLFIALIYSLNHLLRNQLKWQFINHNKSLPIIILIMGTLYGLAVMGPLPGLFFQKDYQQSEIKKNLAALIKQESSLAAGYSFLSNLSSREEIHSLHYAFIGKKQFTNLDYRLPASTEKILFEGSDMLTYQVQFPNSQSWKKYYQTGDDNLRNIISENNFSPEIILDEFVLLTKNSEIGLKLYEILDENFIPSIRENITLENKINFLGYDLKPIEKLSINEMIYSYLPLSVYFTAMSPLEYNYQLKIKFKKNNQLMAEKMYPLAYGLYPTTEWQTDEIIKTTYHLLPDEKINLAEIDQLEIEVLNYYGYLTLNTLRDAGLKITKEEPLKPSIIIPLPQ